MTFEQFASKLQDVCGKNGKNVRLVIGLGLEGTNAVSLQKGIVIPHVTAHFADFEFVRKEAETAFGELAEMLDRASQEDVEVQTG